MGTVSRVHTFASGAILTAAQLNNEFDNLLTSSAINGGLDATNLGVTAGQATASKALVVDASRNLADATGSNRINNLALSGTFESTGAITASAGITSGGNIVSDTDSTDDLGTTGVRWANLFVDDVTVTNNVTIGGTLTLTGGITLNGNTTIGDSSADTLTVNSTITSNLIFTDNTYDIGASGATRPRNLYLSGNGVVGGTLGVTGATTLSSTLGVTGALTATAGITSGSNIVSDSDSTDDLGTTSVRWANLYVDSIGDTGQALAITAGSNNVNVTAGTLALTGAQTISSTLGVTGLITASGGLSGTTGTFSGDVAVGTDKLFVDVSASRVGINSASPGAALDVAHSGTSAAFRVYNSQATDPYGILIDNTAANLSDANYVADFRVGGYSILRLNNSGQMTFAPNSYGGVSAGTLTVKTGSINSDSIRLEAGGTTSTWLESRGYLGHSWYVDSTRKATLDANGLGIGVDSPQGIVHARTGTDKNIRLQTLGSNAGIGVLNDASSSYVPLNLEANDLIVNQYSGGNMGLGVTPSAWSGRTALEIEGASTGYVTSPNGPIAIGSNIYYNGGDKFVGNGYAPLYALSSGNHIWYTSNNNTSGAGAAVTLTQAMTLTNAGLLGIGTSSAEAPLEVVADSSQGYAVFLKAAASGTEGAALRGKGTYNIADAGTQTFTVANGTIVMISENNTGDGAMFFCGYKSATVTLVADPNSRYANTVTAGKISLTKSASSSTVTLTNNSGGTKSFTILKMMCSD